MRFGDYDTDDWGLFCTGVSIEAPEVQRYQIEIPGRQGKLDVTDTLFDEPRYYNRTGTFSFEIAGRAPQDYHDLISEISDALHGRTLKIILDDDPAWYYTGLVEVSADESTGEIKVTADMEPFKKAVGETVVEVSGSGTASLINSRMSAIAAVATTGETTITIEGDTMSLSAGTYYMADYPLYEGVTEWEIETDSTVTITYRQGRL